MKSRNRQLYWANNKLSSTEHSRSVCKKSETPFAGMPHLKKANSLQLSQYLGESLDLLSDGFGIYLYVSPSCRQSLSCFPHYWFGKGNTFTHFRVHSIYLQQEKAIIPDRKLEKVGMGKEYFSYSLPSLLFYLYLKGLETYLLLWTITQCIQESE